jgi:hypothetical protein
MHTLARRAWIWLALAASFALSAVPSAIADAGKHGVVPIFPPHDESDPHEQIEKLFWKVERNLVAIDRLLQSADDADAQLAAVLKDSAGRSRVVVEDIDKILELAQHPHPPGGT